MSHHHDHELTQLDYFEGDQSKLYSGILAHHDGGADSPESKKKVRKIWMITLLLAIVTIIEVSIGLWAFLTGNHNSVVIAIFLILTIYKAFYITKVFMHLGDEDNFFVWLVIGPLFLFGWVITAYLIDAGHGLLMNSTMAQSIADFLP